MRNKKLKWQNWLFGRWVSSTRSKICRIKVDYLNYPIFLLSSTLNRKLATVLISKVCLIATLIYIFAGVYFLWDYLKKSFRCECVCLGGSSLWPSQSNLCPVNYGLKANNKIFAIFIFFSFDAIVRHSKYFQNVFNNILFS